MCEKESSESAAIVLRACHVPGNLARKAWALQGAEMCIVKVQ